MSIPAPTRQAALEHLKSFTPKAGRQYASTRNHDHGAGSWSNVSTLSPHVRHRLVLEEELAAVALSAHSPAAAEKFVQEVFWRTYWKGWLERRPAVWDRYKAERDRDFDTLETSGGLEKAYASAIAGQTGIDCFDHWATELVETGYLHNHARMWFASIWIFTLKLPWALGADFFLRHLMDGDAASNTLSWRWVAGLQTLGKTYLARASNIESYTGGRFSPDPGQLASEAPALVGEPHPSAALAPLSDPMPDAPYALFLHEDDSCFEALALGSAPATIIVQQGAVPRGPQPLGSPARGFTEAALNNAAARAGRAFEVEVVRAVPDSVRDVGGGLPIVCARVPAGPLRDALGRCALTQLVRPVDAYFWPHADKGFFKLKKAIPGAIEQFAWY
ncbi:MAG: FAD-binding domain-containing protein [Sphingomonadales bacterium]